MTENRVLVASSSWWRWTEGRRSSVTSSPLAAASAVTWSRAARDCPTPETLRVKQRCGPRNLPCTERCGRGFHHECLSRYPPRFPEMNPTARLRLDQSSTDPALCSTIISENPSTRYGQSNTDSDGVRNGRESRRQYDPRRTPRP